MGSPALAGLAAGPRGVTAFTGGPADAAAATVTTATTAVGAVGTITDSDAPDLERRFGGLRRLYGEAGYQRVRQARVAVVGLGGVGSWAVEALARSGVARLVLIDLDHIAESNINRQVQALGSTLGMAKAEALRQRIADIHPACEVHVVEEFAGPDNWPSLLPAAVDVLIDACDRARPNWRWRPGLCTPAPRRCAWARPVANSRRSVWKWPTWPR